MRVCRARHTTTTTTTTVIIITIVSLRNRFAGPRDLYIFVNSGEPGEAVVKFYFRYTRGEISSINFDTIPPDICANRTVTEGFITFFFFFLLRLYGGSV